MIVGLTEGSYKINEEWGERKEGVCWIKAEIKALSWSLDASKRRCCGHASVSPRPSTCDYHHEVYSVVNWPYENQIGLACRQSYRPLTTFKHLPTHIQTNWHVCHIYVSKTTDWNTPQINRGSGRSVVYRQGFGSGTLCNTMSVIAFGFQMTECPGINPSALRPSAKSSFKW